MKKFIGFYLAIWATAVALFNTIAYLSPGWIYFEKYTTSFWIGFGLVNACFVGQAICFCASTFGKNRAKKFYGISLIKISYSGLIASTIIGILLMLISPLAGWIAGIICIIILTINIFALLKASAVISLVSSVDKKIKKQTFFIKSLSADASVLCNEAKSNAAKNACHKVYESIRYSDPMSCDELASIEAEILEAFNKFSAAIKADDESAVEIADKLNALLKMRNEKCKILK